MVQDAPEQAVTDAARVLGFSIHERAPGTRSSSARTDEEPLPVRPSADPQAALTGSRPQSRKYMSSREEIDPRELHLAGADLRWADLTDGEWEGVNVPPAGCGGPAGGTQPEPCQGLNTPSSFSQFE